MPVTTSTELAPRGARTRPGAGFRPDIEGLRAVAVVVVLLYHAGLASFRGGYVGVDVFFVISGYLITGLLLSELETTGAVSLRAFYARRSKRLLPSLAVVLLTVAVLAWLLFPPVRRASAYGDTIAAGLYVVNWWFAHTAVDYSAAGMQAALAADRADQGRLPAVERPGLRPRPQTRLHRVRHLVGEHPRTN